ncbi:MAG: type III-B CRISPR module-associated protein Cmr5 [Gammaproteobacteria bacterium]
MMQTIEQRRAALALQGVKSLPQKLDKEGLKEFRSYASGLPAMIHMNGLGQALAFCRLKGAERKSYMMLYQMLSDWLCAKNNPYAGKQDALDGIVESDMAHYQLAQAEALQFLSWVKKFAKAFLAE